MKAATRAVESAARIERLANRAAADPYVERTRALRLRHDNDAATTAPKKKKTSRTLHLRRKATRTRIVDVRETWPIEDAGCCSRLKGVGSVGRMRRAANRAAVDPYVERIRARLTRNVRPTTVRRRRPKTTGISRREATSSVRIDLDLVPRTRRSNETTAVSTITTPTTIRPRRSDVERVSTNRTAVPTGIPRKRSPVPQRCGEIGVPGTRIVDDEDT